MLHDPGRERPATSREDWRGLGDLVSMAVERVATPVEGMHRAISDRWLGLAGPAAGLLRATSRAFTAPIYGSVRLGARTVGWSLAQVAAGIDAPPLWHSPGGSTVRAVANATWGDELANRSSPLSIELDLRDRAGRPIAVDPAALARSYPEPTGSVVVMLHGLGETEQCWFCDDTDPERIGLGDAMATLPATPLFIRYNSGRRIADTAVELSGLLERVVGAWPVPVSRIDFVGYSMGGLVARSAVLAGAGRPWVDAVGRLVTLGAPHLGAPLEKAATVAAWGLRVAPESRPLGELLDTRSAGIKDLRFGALTTEDGDADSDRLLVDSVGPHQLPPWITEHYLAAVITSDPAHPVGVALGDLVVRVGSATGRGRRRRLDPTDTAVLPGRRHLDVLSDPEARRLVVGWLAGD